MTDKNARPTKTNGGFVQEVLLRVRLILRLMLDQRVSPWLKLLPVAALVYLVNPFDIPGPFDDIAVVSLALFLFVDLCPQAIVEEHMQSLRSGIDASAQTVPVEDDDVVDAEYREVHREDPFSKR